MRTFLEKTKYISLIGVFFLLIASLEAFAWGTLKAVESLVEIVQTGGKGAQIAVTLIEVVDAFLVAIALYIFAVSVYEMFIADLSLPDWMVAHNLAELKAKLSSVIVLVMAVKFLEKLVEWKDPAATLQFGLSIAVISVVLIALSYFGKKD